MRVINQDGFEVERQRMAILSIIANSRKAVGSKIIARLLEEQFGIELSERGGGEINAGNEFTHPFPPSAEAGGGDR